MTSSHIKIALATCATLSVALIWPDLAHASQSVMPSDDIFTTVAKSATGPTARGVGMIAIAAAGFATAFSEGQSMYGKGARIALGLSTAFNAGSYFLPFFGYSGGALL